MIKMYLVYVEMENYTKVYMVLSTSNQNAIEKLLQERPSNKINVSISAIACKDDIALIG